MKIQILGTGCRKCKKLYEDVEKAINHLELEDVQLVKVEKLPEIAAMGVMMTPALAIDGLVVVTGRVPSLDELIILIQGVDDTNTI